jgi:hypothetical protein
MLISNRTSVVARLGTAQTLAWASSYYLPAMLATAMAADLGVSVTTVFAAFSFALIVSAVFGRWAGQLIDHHGGRPVLISTNGLFAAGLVVLLRRAQHHPSGQLRVVTMLISHRTSVVARLGTAQTLAWASSYYLPAMLATAMAAELGVSVTTLFAAD